MSSLIVSEETMQQVVTAMHSHTSTNTLEAADLLGDRLYSMNQRAVSMVSLRPAPAIPPFRWIHKEKPDKDDLSGWCKLLWALDCLINQCDVEHVREEALFQRLKLCRDLLRAKIVRELPEYKAAVQEGVVRRDADA